MTKEEFIKVVEESLELKYDKEESGLVFINNAYQKKTSCIADFEILKKLGLNRTDVDRNKVSRCIGSVMGYGNINSLLRISGDKIVDGNDYKKFLNLKGNSNSSLKSQLLLFLESYRDDFVIPLAEQLFDIYKDDIKTRLSENLSEEEINAILKVGLKK
ncbi:hypothetical protein R9C00_23240 [Flammeovirgaceae bacterium SG7u.111]|nr:hypothetical protein [Flammeovirgaceae bacterium SG7u.132]WPO34621.1 hypothetical protein R9C00_23240 [Flammeovirgaceae bacterium SG7u.111]